VSRPIALLALSTTGAALAAVGVVLLLTGSSLIAGAAALAVGGTSAGLSLRVPEPDGTRWRVFGVGAGLLIGLSALMVVWG
jgi:hypothetical protein